MDHILIHDDRHLEWAAKEYKAYFNQERPHQGIEQWIPDQYDLTRSKPTSGRITSKAILGVLIWTAQNVSAHGSRATCPTTSS